MKMEIPHRPSQETPWEQMQCTLYSMQQSVANLRDGINPESVADHLDQQLRYLLHNYGQHFAAVPWGRDHQRQLDLHLGKPSIYWDEPIAWPDELHEPKNQLFSLLIELQGIHPTISGVGFDDGEFYLSYQDGPKMEMGEFEWGSRTRRILEEMADLITRAMAEKAQT